MKQITVTRALAQIKALNDRIGRGTSVSFVTTTTGGKHESGKPEQEVRQQLVANLKSVSDMIKQRAVLKGAVVRSNAVTKVTIGGVEMTVAEAIERKASIMYDKALLNQLAHQLQTQQAKAERANVLMQPRLDQLIQTTVGKERSKVDEAELKAITDMFNKQNRSELVDPCGLTKVIEEMQKEINAFDEEVDFSLSEVNAVTKITV